MQTKVANKKPTRNSAIELLRIISMIMVVFHHFAVHGGFAWGIDEVTIPHFWYNLIAMGGKIGVNIFVLISGYFLIEDNGPLFNLKKLLKFWGQIIFYSLSIYLIFLISGSHSFNIKEFIMVCFPITFKDWWFASTYFVLFLIHPFLNKLLTSLDRKTYQILLVLFILMLSIIPTFTTQAYQSNDLIWFIVIYSIAGYIKLYGLNGKLTTRVYGIWWLIFSALTFLSSIIILAFSEKINFLSGYSTYFFGLQTISCLFISISAFMCFVNLKMKYYKWLNVIASTTFGIYLIHDNNLMRSFLWLDLFKNFQYQNSLLIIPYSIFAATSVFAACALIDLIRQKCFEKPYMKLVDKYSDTLMKLVRKIYLVFKNTVFGK